MERPQALMNKKHSTVEFVDKLPKEVEEKMHKDLVEYESSHGIDVNYKKFAVILKDEQGDVLGALNAFTAYAEVYIEDIWVSQSFRGKGYGEKLLQALENYFKGKGFNNINLVTSAFSAPEFYKKCGFTVEFVRENKKNPQLTKTFFIKYFEDKLQTQGILMTPKIDFRFAPAQPSQRSLIHDWLGQKHLKEWIHGVRLQNTLNGIEKFFQEDLGTIYWIGYDEEIPFAFLITSAQGDDAITLDLFICNLDYLGKGLSVPMIRQFLISQFPSIKRVLIDPEATNTRAIHVYQKVGFKITGEFIASWHSVPHYQMELNMKDLLNF